MDYVIPLLLNQALDTLHQKDSVLIFSFKKLAERNWAGGQNCLHSKRDAFASSA